MNGIMLSKPLISIIIPNYNHAPFLKERIDSVLQQTFTDFEVIILDDKSSDNSKEVIELYRGHEKISHVIYNEKNSGSTFKQWKKGIELAKGNWIWIAESDDAADLNFLDKLLKCTIDHQDVGLVYSRSKIIDENGNLKKLYNINTVPTIELKESNIDEATCFLYDRKDFLKQYMITENSIPNASAVLFKKNLVNQEIFESIKKMKLNGDWIFWISILHQTNVLFCTESLNSFRHHSKTVRSTVNKELPILEYFHVLKEMKDNNENLTKAIDRVLYFLNENVSFNVKMRVYLKVISLGFPLRLIKTLFNQ